MLTVDIDMDKKVLTDFIKFSAGIEDTISEGLKKAMLYVEGEAKQNFGGSGQLKVRSGRLRSSITSGVDGLFGWVGTDVSYAKIHEEGGIIKPTNGKYLKFQIQGQWKTVKQVIIPKRPFLQPAMDSSTDKIGSIILDEIMEAFKQ